MRVRRARSLNIVVSKGVGSLDGETGPVEKRSIVAASMLEYCCGRVMMRGSSRYQVHASLCIQLSVQLSCQALMHQSIATWARQCRTCGTSSRSVRSVGSLWLGIARLATQAMSQPRRHSADHCCRSGCIRPGLSMNGRIRQKMSCGGIEATEQLYRCRTTTYHRRRHSCAVMML